MQNSCVNTVQRSSEDANSAMSKHMPIILLFQCLMKLKCRPLSSRSYILATTAPAQQLHRLECRLTRIQWCILFHDSPKQLVYWLFRQLRLLLHLLRLPSVQFRQCPSLSSWRTPISCLSVPQTCLTGWPMLNYPSMNLGQHLDAS